jgi:anti-sigma regulatory factor (Ser/Thr protein kinase)
MLAQPMSTEPGQLVLAIALPNEPASAAKARAAVTRAFAGMPDGFLDDAQLLVSETIVNAISHSRRGPDSPIRVSGYVRGTVARIEVADEGPGFEAGGERRGLGTRILDEVATSWGTGSISGLATTWFELDAAERPLAPR